MPNQMNRQALVIGSEWMMVSLFRDAPRRRVQPANDNAERPSGALRVANAGLNRGGARRFFGPMPCVGVSAPPSEPTGNCECRPYASNEG